MNFSIFWNIKNISMLSVIAVLVIAAVVVVPGQQSAYAQKQNREPGPCPPGFEINKGTCQAEPTTVTEVIETQVCPDNLAVSPSGEQCILGLGGNAQYQICPDGTRPLITGRCQDIETGEIVDKIRICNPVGQEPHPLDPNLCYAVVPMITETTTVTTQVCNTAGTTLNEESGMCEVKPGQGRQQRN